MEDETPEIEWNWKAVAHWTLTFLLNLPLPLALGIETCRNNWGIAGIALACLCLYSIGFYFAGRGFAIVRRIVLGGSIVAVSQLCPIIQFSAGLIAIGTWNRCAALMGINRGDHPFVEFYAITLMAGQMMLAASLGIGLGLRLIYKFHTSEEALWPW